MSKLRRSRGGTTVRMLHWCPGCNDVHGFLIEGGPPHWTFNGDMEHPTFAPSMLVFVTHTTDDDDKPLPAPINETLCHYFLAGGQIQFCTDSPHALAGQTVPLPDWPYAPGTYYGIEEE